MNAMDSKKWADKKVDWTQVLTLQKEELQLRFLALLDFESCYYNTSALIMPPKNFTFD